MSAWKDESGRFMASPGKRVVILFMDGDPEHAEAVQQAFRDCGRKADVLPAQKSQDALVTDGGEAAFRPGSRPWRKPTAGARPTPWR